MTHDTISRRRSAEGRRSERRRLIRHAAEVLLAFVLINLLWRVLPIPDLGLALPSLDLSALPDPPPLPEWSREPLRWARLALVVGLLLALMAGAMEDRRANDGDDPRAGASS